MTELNSCFTRNQFKRSTAARLFTPLRSRKWWCLQFCTPHSVWLSFVVGWSTRIISTQINFPTHKATTPNRKWSELPTEKRTPGRNRQCWNEVRVLIRGNTVHISFEMPVHYFAVNCNTNSALRRPDVNPQFCMCRSSHTVLKKVQVESQTTPRQLLNTYGRFGGNCCRHFRACFCTNPADSCGKNFRNIWTVCQLTRRHVYDARLDTLSSPPLW